MEFIVPIARACPAGYEGISPRQSWRSPYLELGPPVVVLAVVPECDAPGF
jgi:hypothetical protein